jgi:hypothetical protein
VKLTVFSRKRQSARKNRGFSRFHGHVMIRCMKSKAVVITIHKVHLTFEKDRGGECLGKTFCKGPVCAAESDCYDSDINVSSPSPRSLDFDIKQACELGTEYQMHLTVTVSLVTVLGGIGSGAKGKGKQEGSVAENQTKSFDLTAQQFCGHGRY